MEALPGGWLLLSLVLAEPVAAPRDREVTYGFATKHYLIEMRVSFPEPYSGKRLVFYSSLDPTKEVCYSADGGSLDKCVEQFVGAVVLVTYSVRLLDGRAPTAATIREHVTVTAQSPGLPGRAPFSKTQRLVKGIGSDVQVFGYDEAPVKEADRARVREERTGLLWRLYKQELYVDQEPQPFAIVEWKHTLNRISIVRIYSPPDRE